MQKSNQHRGDRNKTYRSVQGNRLLQVGYLHLRVSNLGRREAVDFNYFFSNFSAWHRHQCLVYKKKKTQELEKQLRGSGLVFSLSQRKLITPTFPSCVAVMTSEGIPKGWMRLMMSLSEKLSGSPVINSMAFCSRNFGFKKNTDHF